MKSFVALVCLVAVVVAQGETPKPEPTTTLADIPTAEASTTQGSTSDEEAPATDATTAEPPVDCDFSVADSDEAVLVPNPEECKSYYVCDAGLPVLMPCPDGLHFNPDLSVCDWPESANCTLNEIPEAAYKLGN